MKTPLTTVSLNTLALAAALGMTLATPPSHAQEAQPAADTNHAPRLVCEEPVYNFGEVDNSQTVEHTFILRNEGDLSLEIGQVKPACGCTVANLSEKVIAPGKEATLATRLSLRGRTGRQSKSISVDSNDPQNPRIQLRLEGNVVQPTEITPNRVFFANAPMDRSETNAVTIRSNTKPLKISEVTSSVPQFATLLEIVAEGREYRIHVSTVPPLAEGKIDGFIRVASAEPGTPDINIPVSATVQGALSIAPLEIVLATQITQPQVRYVVLRPAQVGSFEITEVLVPDPQIVVNVATMGMNGFRVQLSNITPSPELNGKALRIRTNLEQMQEITIPFRLLPGP